MRSNVRCPAFTCGVPPEVGIPLLAHSLLSEGNWQSLHRVIIKKILTKGGKMLVK